MPEIAIIPQMDTRLIGLLKDTFINFIWAIDIPMEQKLLIRKEIGSNWFDSRFQVKELEATLAECYRREHAELINNLYTDRTSFWIDICKAAAQHSDRPDDIATHTLESLEKTIETIKSKL